MLCVATLLTFPDLPLKETTVYKILFQALKVIDFLIIYFLAWCTNGDSFKYVSIVCTIDIVNMEDTIVHGRSQI